MTPPGSTVRGGPWCNTQGLGASDLTRVPFAARMFAVCSFFLSFSGGMVLWSPQRVDKFGGLSILIFLWVVDFVFPICLAIEMAFMSISFTFWLLVLWLMRRVGGVLSLSIISRITKVSCVDLGVGVVCCGRSRWCGRCGVRDPLRVGRVVLLSPDSLDTWYCYPEFELRGRCRTFTMHIGLFELLVGQRKHHHRGKTSIMTSRYLRLALSGHLVQRICVK